LAFSLVPKLATLNELERRNGQYFAFLSGHLGATYIPVVKLDPYCLPQKK